MRLPRDVSGDDLAVALRAFGYTVLRQTGSHVRLVTQQRGEHHVTIPRHKPLRLGTLSEVLADVSEHFGLTKDEVARQLLG